MRCVFHTTHGIAAFSGFVPIASVLDFFRDSELKCVLDERENVDVWCDS